MSEGTVTISIEYFDDLRDKYNQNEEKHKSTELALEGIMKRCKELVQLFNPRPGMATIVQIRSDILAELTGIRDLASGDYPFEIIKPRFKGEEFKINY